MRMLVKVIMDVEAANKAFNTGELQPIMTALIEKIKPEAAYFTLNNGDRTAYYFFNMTNQADMPYFFEPIFDKLKAKIELSPAMTLDDLQSGFQKIMVGK